jgi:hypothetical protein
MLSRFIQFFIISVPIALFVWLLVIDIAPSGTFVVRHEVSEVSPYVHSVLPDERVLAIDYNQEGEPFVTIIDEPTYFTVQLPNTHFDSVEIEVEFDGGDQKIVELGALMDIFSRSFDLRPIQNTIIDSLDWESLGHEGLVLYQRNEDFASVQEFLSNPPDRSSIATYHASLDVPYRMDSYKSLGSMREIDVSLRGYHKLLTYIKDEELYFQAKFMDMNRTTGSDDVVVTVRNEQGEEITRQELLDDHNKTENQISSTREVIVKQSDLPEGVYTVEFSGTSDIFWRQFITPQRYAVFNTSLYIADDIGYLPESRATTFFTNAKNFTIETLHADGTQRLAIGKQEVFLDKSHEKHHVSIDDTGVVEGRTPIGDVKIVGDGKFSFSRDAFFEPDPVKLNTHTDLDALNVDYILSEYIAPEFRDGWDVASAVFDVNDIADKNNAATFTFSTPFIVQDQQMVKIHAINAIFRKKRLNLQGVLLALRDRLPFGL